MKMRQLNVWALALMALVFSACKDKEKDPQAELKEAVVRQYATVVAATYDDAYSQTVALQNAINSFVANPTAATHQAAKDAWLAAREVYGQTEAFRFGDGPIDDADGPEGLMNAWPLDENYIDYVDGQPNAGIINDTTVSIDAATLASLNEAGGERNIALGYHAIEFLLWGQDDADASLLTSGARPHTDYITGGAGTASNQDRRGDFLVLATSMLVDNLLEIRNEWTAGDASNYRATFEGLENDEALRRIFTGIGVLSKSELAGERMFTALDNQSQEDEHSCFSDNTHRDIIQNFRGIRNVYFGTFTRSNGSIVSGVSLKDLGDEYDETLSHEIAHELIEAYDLLDAIPVPFDNALTQESVGGSGPIQTAVNALQALGDKFAEIAGKMDITISTALPE